MSLPFLTFLTIALMAGALLMVQLDVLAGAG